MRILIISFFNNSENTICLSGRTSFLVKAFVQSGINDISVLTTDFYHRKKRYHNMLPTKKEGVKFHYVHIPPYKNNFSFKRIISLYRFAVGVKKFLRNSCEEYNLIYCYIPSSFAAIATKGYIKKHESKLVIDVMDLLPESLYPVVGNNVIMRTILSPWKQIANWSYSIADYISSESVSFAQSAHTINPHVPYSYTYLGIDTNVYNNMVSQSTITIERIDGVINLCYGGNLGSSYDFDAIINALRYVDEKGIRYKMYFVGGGEQEQRLKNLIITNGLNAEVTGVVSYKDFLKYLSLCDIAFNSFKRNTPIVHSYKFNDYISANLFVLNSLKGETSAMIEKYRVGLNYDNNLNEVLYDVCKNWTNNYSLWKQNNQLLIDAELNANIIYPRLIKHIISTINNQSN